MSSDMMDFDALFSEIQEQVHVFKIYGKEYEIPVKIPYGIVFEYINLEKLGKDAIVPNETVIRMFTSVFGKDTAIELGEHPTFDTEKMGELLKWAMEKYNVLPKEEKKTQRGKANLKLVQSQSET